MKLEVSPNLSLKGGLVPLFKADSMNELDENQLKILMTGTPFNGCFTKDDLNYIPNGNTIYNLNGQSHWVAMHRNNGDYYYFDSYGVVPPQLIEDMVCENLDKTNHGFYRYNTKNIQGLNSSSCGYYCVAFLKWMNDAKQKYKAFDDFVDLFSDKYDHNEVILNELLHQF